MTFPKTKARRKTLRVEAEERQEAYNKLSLEEKISKLPEGGANKQRAKLMALLEKQNKKQEKETTNV